jgi:Zn-finger nucleic acid-binding protein
VHCPRDTDVVMMRRRFSAGQPVMIDECPACGGVWLDADELSAIRASSGTRG